MDCGSIWDDFVVVLLYAICRDGETEWNVGKDVCGDDFGRIGCNLDWTLNGF